MKFLERRQEHPENHIVIQEHLEVAIHLDQIAIHRLLGKILKLLERRQEHLENHIVIQEHLEVGHRNQPTDS